LSDSGHLHVSWSDRWIRRSIIAVAGLGFSLPFFELLNRLEADGEEILEELPRRNVVFLSNHQTYFTEAIAFFHLVYIRHRFPLEDPFLRFSAAEETMKKNLLTEFMTKAGGVTFRRSFREGGAEVNRPVDLEGVTVPVRIDGFRSLLLHKQLPGRIFQRARIRIHPPLDLGTFYGEPYAKDAGRALVARLSEILGDPA
jgi:1-acyl-sn-glycerol-3-phosphate acyltransferase